jgi:hypothetical protein
MHYNELTAVLRLMIYVIEKKPLCTSVAGLGFIVMLLLSVCSRR